MWGAWTLGGWVWGMWGRDSLTLDCPMTKVEAARNTSKQSREGSLGLAQQELTKKKYFVILAGLFPSMPVCCGGCLDRMLPEICQGVLGLALLWAEDQVCPLGSRRSSSAPASFPRDLQTVSNEGWWRFTPSGSTIPRERKLPDEPQPPVPW